MKRLRKQVCRWFNLIPREQAEQLLHLVREDERRAAAPLMPDASRVDALIRRLVAVRCAHVAGDNGQLRLGVSVSIPLALANTGERLIDTFLAARLSREVERQIQRQANGPRVSCQPRTIT